MRTLASLVVIVIAACGPTGMSGPTMNHRVGGRDRDRAGAVGGDQRRDQRGVDQLIGRADDHQAIAARRAPPARDRRAIARDQHRGRAGLDRDAARALGQRQPDDRQLGAALLAEGAEAIAHERIARHPAVTRAERQAASALLYEIIHKHQDNAITRYLFRPVSICLLYTSPSPRD